jgi:hypothetical protein
MQTSKSRQSIPTWHTCQMRGRVKCGREVGESRRQRCSSDRRLDVKTGVQRVYQRDLAVLYCDWFPRPPQLGTLPESLQQDTGG